MIPIKYEPEPGTYVIHERTGNKYIVLGIGEMKDRDTGEWWRCVIYQPVATPQNTYARDVADFLQKFVKAK